MGKIIGVDLSHGGGCASVIDGGEPVEIMVSNDGPISESPDSFLKGGKRNIVRGYELSHQEQTALYLNHIRRCARDYLGEDVSGAVISVPGYYPTMIRQYIWDAAEIEGLYCNRLITEPVSAAAAYCWKNSIDTGVLSVVIKDGWFDMALVDAVGGVVEVLAVTGCLVLYREAEAIEDLISDLLIDAEYKKEDVGVILLSGEENCFPGVIYTLERCFSGKKILPMPKDIFAAGAALLGGKLAGEEACKDYMLLDVIPYSLSIETAGGVATKFIERNTTIPTKNTVTFSTEQDYQAAVDVTVVEGEAPLTKDNYKVGSMRLEGIEPAKGGEPVIEISVDIDVRGMAHLSAKNVKTGFKKETLLNPMALSESQISASRERIKPILDEIEVKREKERLAAEWRSLEKGRSELFALYENYERRVELEESKTTDNAMTGLLKELLPVIDNFERALESASRDPQVVPYLQGFSMIYRQLLDNLDKAGVVRIECVGRTFDPTFHEAVVHVDDPMVAESIVVEEYQAGYLYNGQVLRVSKVKVAN